MIDSDTFRSQRKTAYSKLCSFLELFSKSSSSLSKLSVSQTEMFIGHLMVLMTSSDTHL